MRVLVAIICLCAGTFVTLHGKQYSLVSPDSNIEVRISVEGSVSFSVYWQESLVAGPSEIAMELDGGRMIGRNETVSRASTQSVNNMLKPVVAHKNAVVRDEYNSLSLRLRSGFTISFRAYNDGVAYRFESSLKGDLTVVNEVADISFPEGTTSWYPLEDSFLSHNERTYLKTSLDTVTDKHLASLPALFVVNGINVLLTESDLEDYPGMWIKGNGNGGIQGVWPAYPAAERLIRDRTLSVTERKPYIAATKGTRIFPWRALIISPTDGGLIESEMVFKLAPECKLKETGWIRPGKVAWDWWNANNIYGVDFRAGLNTDTYKYYIDFASENGIEYIILDEGWYRLGNVLDISPQFDLTELFRYAEEKNVGIILWVVWKTFYDQIDEALPKFAEWGAKGIKVDFMQRDDQPVVNFYHEIALRAAEYQMLVDFHGSYKPVGMIRTYPNVLTSEGLKGLEHCKWSDDANPEHNVTIPFIRMVAGPMDYTPGAMVNMDRASFKPMYNRPASLGTRVHQMAMYVVYESPLQMLADNPSNYRREPECTSFMASVPVVWDETKVLHASIGDYVVVARRHGDDWYIGAMSDWTAREFDIDLSFLPGGDYVVTSFADGINADRYASDYKKSITTINANTAVNIKMAPGGGWVARIAPK
ncbi:MAG: glycoside hydrolase family 97 protein [Bacteroidales bacterium]